MCCASGILCFGGESPCNACLHEHVDAVLETRLGLQAALGSSDMCRAISPCVLGDIKGSKSRCADLDGDRDVV